jgi:two-component SAPR family response regulator
LNWAGSSSSEQLIAAEMLCDEGFAQFCVQRVASNPTFAIVMRRIETMHAVTQQYQIPSEQIEQDVDLDVQALGTFNIASAVFDVDSLKPLPREILVYLLDHQRASRDDLNETFWPDYSPGRQVSNLHTAIYSLRRALGKEAIEFDQQVYGLAPEIKLRYDVQRYERAASIAERLPVGDPRRLFALTEAINSYQGPFCPDLNTDWALERRRALEMRYLDLLATHSEEALIRDQPLRAVNTLRQALEIDPYRDDTNLHYLEALGRLGRRNEIVAHYQSYVRLLADELGLDPPQAVSELYSRLIG